MSATAQSAVINARYRTDCTAYYGQTSIEVFTLLAAATLRSEVLAACPKSRSQPDY